MSALPSKEARRLADMSPAERFEHGTRARYVAGPCRCDDCRRANRDYGRSRRKATFNGLVDAAPARAHLLQLSAAGIGKRAVAAAGDVALSLVMDVRSGAKLRIRAETARRILAIDAAAVADHAVVPAKETWRAVCELLKMGWTKGEIAQALGNTQPALQLGRRHVLARTALAVEKLLRRARAETPDGTDDLCTSCGHSHSPENRARLIRPMVVARESMPAEIAAEWPCFYPNYANEPASQQRLWRDSRVARGEARETA